MLHWFNNIGITVCKEKNAYQGNEDLAKYIQSKVKQAVRNWYFIWKFYSLK